MNNKHLLILRFSALGDVAMTIPVIYSLAQQYHDLKITVATRPFFAKLFFSAPPNISIFNVDLKNKYSGVAGLFRLIKDLSKLHPSEIADLHNIFRTWLIDTYFRLKGIRTVMVRKGRQKRKKFLKSKTQQENFISRYVDVFARLGLPVDLKFKCLSGIDKTDFRFEKGKTYVGIAPFARYYTKTYPPELMKEVIKILCDNGVNVILFGAPGKESEIIKHWANEIEGCESAADSQGLAGELSIMGKLQLMVTMDSANQHLAALTGVEVMTIWGGTTPLCGFLGYGVQTSDCLVANVSCQPCSVAGGPTCKNNTLACMHSLSPKYIASKILEKVNHPSI